MSVGVCLSQKTMGEKYPFKILRDHDVNDKGNKKSKRYKQITTIVYVKKKTRF